VKKYPIIIDPEFKALCPPLSADERAQLKESIRKDGLLDQIILWGTPNGFVIVDGHHRYKILTELVEEDGGYGLKGTDLESLKTVKAELRTYGWQLHSDNEDFRLQYFTNSLIDREAVKLWILEHQVGRRNLTKQQRIEMVARIVLMRQEQTAKTSKTNLKQGDTVPDVGKTPTSGKKTVPAAAKEFDVPEKPLQAAVTSLKDNQPQPTECDICQAPFESKGAMKAHRKKEHAEEMARRRAEQPSLRSPVEASEVPPQEGDSTSSAPLQDSERCAYGFDWTEVHWASGAHGVACGRQSTGTHILKVTKDLSQVTCKICKGAIPTAPLQDSEEDEERFWFEKDKDELGGFDLSHKMFGDLYVHERFDQAPRDASWVWLVENLRSGKAELWRSCDLTRIARKGEKVNKRTHGIFGVGAHLMVDETGKSIGLKFTHETFAEWMQLAEERLKEIKAAPPQPTTPLQESVKFKVNREGESYRPEKRRNRSRPLESKEALYDLCRKMIKAGFEKLKQEGGDPSHLDSAKTILSILLAKEEGGNRWKELSILLAKEVPSPVPPSAPAPAINADEITDECIQENTRPVPKRGRKPKLSPEDISQIKAMIATGSTYVYIADHYKVSPATVTNIVKQLGGKDKIVAAKTA
jgi:hypothetical protein